MTYIAQVAKEYLKYLLELIIVAFRDHFLVTLAITTVLVVLYFCCPEWGSRNRPKAGRRAANPERE